MNISKNISVVFLGNFLASFIFASSLSLLWAVNGGYEASGLVGFIGLIISLPLLVGTISGSIIFGHLVEGGAKESSKIELLSFLTQLVSLIFAMIIANKTDLGRGSAALFSIWLILQIILGICFRWLGNKVLKNLNIKKGVIVISVPILIISFLLAFSAEYISRQNKANEAELPIMTCENDNDCSSFKCEGHRWYCDKNGFPKCGSDSICHCYFGCI